MQKYNFRLPVTIFKEVDNFIAYTPALDLSTCGRTFEEAKKRFAEAVNLFFEELDRMGTTEQVLRNLGWKRVRKEWYPMSTIAHEMHQMQVAYA